jgi:hypothetical protein
MRASVWLPLLASAGVLCTACPAVIRAAQIRLAWDPPTNNTDGTGLTDLSGYSIHYGTASGVYTVVTNVGNATTSVVATLDEGQTYYFVGRTYSTTRVESSNSVELAWTVKDVTRPVITPPADPTLPASSTGTVALPNLVAETVVTDNVTAAAGIIVRQMPTAGTAVGVGVTTVTIKARDLAGNVAQATVLVTVVDQMPSDAADNQAQPTAALTALHANRAPVVSAGADLTIRVNESADLQGFVTDDSLPENSMIVATWTSVSGPSTVTFVNARAAATLADMSIAGTYVLRLTASDGALTASDEVTVTVLPALPSPPVGVRIRTP